MQILSNVVNFLLGLGSAVFVPIIMIIAGLVVRMKVKDAISAGVTLGVAFSGMSMLISYMTGAISPAATAMLENSGINLPIVDGGWTTMSTISWSWPYAFLMFPLMIVINIIMIALNRTQTFNADLWNVWGKIFTAVGVYYITNSVIAAFVIAAIQIVFELKAADYHHYRVEKLSGIPGVTCTHKMIFLGAVMYPIDLLLRKIPGLNKSFNAADLREKIGIFAENHILGLILGVLFGILARFDVAGCLTLGIQCATAMTLFPVISKYFMMALEPISNAVSEFMQEKFKGKELWVGLDWPFLGGANEIWLGIIWSAVCTVVWAFFLPGNEILPFAGVLNTSAVVPAYFVTQGNIIRMLILVALYVPVFLWVGTAFAPFVTDLANATGAVTLEAGQLISNSSIDGPVFTYAFSHFLKCMQGDFIPLIILIVWIVCFVFYSREMIKQAKTEGAKSE